MVSGTSLVPRGAQFLPLPQASEGGRACLCLANRLLDPVQAADDPSEGQEHNPAHCRHNDLDPGYRGRRQRRFIIAASDEGQGNRSENCKPPEEAQHHGQNWLVPIIVTRVHKWASSGSVWGNCSRVSTLASGGRW